MKKNLCVVLLLLSVCLGSHAQLKVDFGSYAFGVTGNYAIGSDYKNVGGGLMVQKFLGSHLRSCVHGEYYFKDKGLKLIEFGGDFHYVFPLTKQMGVYPIVGIGYSILKYDGGYVSEILPGGIEVIAEDEEDGKLNFNLGAGYEYYVTPSFKAFGEVKYHHISDLGRTLLTVGVAYVW